MRSIKKGRKKKRGNDYQFRKNHVSNQRKKLKKQKIIPEPALESNWERKKTVKKNLDEMGLVYDLNNCIALPSTKQAIGPKEQRNEVVSKQSQNPDKSQKVIQALEQEAGKKRITQPRKSTPEVLFCVSMIEKYGNDYERMAKDRKNYYQETANQIKKKILHFQRTHQYRAYLAAKVGATSLTK